MSETTAVAVREPIVNVHLQTFEDVQRVAKMFAESGYFQDARDLAKAGVKIMAGAELGIGPFAAMQGINLIQGKLGLAAGLVSSRIKASGKYDYRIKTWTNDLCVLTFLEGGKPVGESSFSLDDARRAELVKAGSNWAKWPKAMLFSRALTQGARAYAPDVFHGPVYTPDELGAEVDVETGEVVQAPMPAGAKDITPPTAPKVPDTPLPLPPSTQAKADPVVPGGNGKDKAPTYSIMGAITMVAKMGGGLFKPEVLESYFGPGIVSRKALEAFSVSAEDAYRAGYDRLHAEYHAAKMAAEANP